MAQEIAATATLPEQYNAVQHGVLSAAPTLPWEDPSEYQGVLSEFMTEYQPSGMTEAHLVEELALIIIRKRRLTQAENALIHSQLAKSHCRYSQTARDGLSYIPTGKGGNNTDVKEALLYNREEDTEEIARMEALLGKIRTLLADDLSYEDMAAQCDTEMLEYWEEWVTENGHAPNTENFYRFLHWEIEPHYSQYLEQLKARPAVRRQAIGVSYQPSREYDTLIRYHTTLSRAFEKTLAMLLKVQELRRESNVAAVSVSQ